jgi:hypothetical protein
VKAFVVLIGLVVLGSVSNANAQVAPEFSRGAHIVSLGGKADGACLKALQTLSSELKVIRFPDDWTIAATCNSVTWEAARHRAGNPPTKTAFTGLKPKITVINAAVFQELEPVYRRTLAHELGHIRCNCSSEGIAEDEGQRLLEKLPEEVVAERK